MRSLGGLVLVAGIGVALFVYLPAPVDSGPSLDQFQRIDAPRAAQVPSTKFTPVARLSAFAAPIELSMPVRPRNFAKLEPAPAPAPPAPVVAQAQPAWQTTVAVAAPAPT